MRKVDLIVVQIMVYYIRQVCLNIKSNDDVMINKGIESLGKFCIYIYNIYIHL